MSDHAVHPSAHDDHADHGVAKYVYVFLALCVLTGASFFTYSELWPYRHLPAVGWAFMMAVSCTKAMLVILFFMHLKYEASWKYVLTIPAAIMSVFLLLALIPDIGLRMRNYSDIRLRHVGTPEIQQQLINVERAHEQSEHAGEHHE
jgi:cytochrome c oxidase subunit 4